MYAGMVKCPRQKIYWRFYKIKLIFVNFLPRWQGMSLWFFKKIASISVNLTIKISYLQLLYNYGGESNGI